MDDIRIPEGLEESLRDALGHLFDPIYRPDARLLRLLGIEADQGNEALRARLLTALHGLEPAPHVPQRAHAWRLYRVLSLRYLHKLTQEETAQQLSITVRHLAREQAEAIRLLARKLVRETGPSAAAIDEGSSENAWQTQVERELSSLRERSPDTSADVCRALEDVVRVTGVLAAKHRVTVQVEKGVGGYTAAIHPAVLHQALVATITHLIRGAPHGRITLSTEGARGHVEIILRVSPSTVPPPPEDWLARELLVSQAGVLRWEPSPEALTVRLSLPLSPKRTVLVIDDNEDLVHFYGLCMTGTNYQMVHLAEGQDAFAAITANRPDVIVLDLMLPDIDGWELLAQLHEHPVSQEIPIVVCSVVQEEELAYALGATVCIAKPVRRQQFLAALNEALHRGAAAERTAHESK